ncbi:MAG TPA: hypothetical protein VJ890_14745 [Vineibacter sp.]|nr:hypothetical protein [Vineibacter sp.]
MKSFWSVPLAMALVVAATGLSSAQQPYPTQFANQWTNGCLNSCQTNSLFRGKERLCPSYCGCVVQQAQASVPLEMAMQAEKDLAAKKNTPEVQRVNDVVRQCQTRVLGPAPAGKPTTNVAR